MRKLAFVVLAVFGLVNVSFGAWISDKNEEMYQKLKAELEEKSINEYNADVDESKCFKEDGSPAYKEFGGEEHRKNRKRAIVCRYKNVLAFVDEYRANKGKGGIYTYNEIKKIPRFKNDIDNGIYYHQSLESLLKESLKKWEEDKIKLEMFYY